MRRHVRRNGASAVLVGTLMRDMMPKNFGRLYKLKLICFCFGKFSHYILLPYDFCLKNVIGEDLPVPEGLAVVLIGRRAVRGRAFSAEQFLLETAPPLDGLSYKGQGGRVT